MRQGSCSWPPPSRGRRHRARPNAIHVLVALTGRKSAIIFYPFSRRTPSSSTKGGRRRAVIARSPTEMRFGTSPSDTIIRPFLPEGPCQSFSWLADPPSLGRKSPFPGSRIPPLGEDLPENDGGSGSFSVFRLARRALRRWSFLCPTMRFLSLAATTGPFSRTDRPGMGPGPGSLRSWRKRVYGHFGRVCRPFPVPRVRDAGLPPGSGLWLKIGIIGPSFAESGSSAQLLQNSYISRAFKSRLYNDLADRKRPLRGFLGTQYPKPVSLCPGFRTGGSSRILGKVWNRKSQS